MIQLFCFFAPTSPYVLSLYDKAKCSSWCDQSIMNLDQTLVCVIFNSWMFIQNIYTPWYQNIISYIYIYPLFQSKNAFPMLPRKHGKPWGVNEFQPQALIHIAREVRMFRPFDALLSSLGSMDLIVHHERWWLLSKIFFLLLVYAQEKTHATHTHFYRWRRDALEQKNLCPHYPSFFSEPYWCDIDDSSL